MPFFACKFCGEKEPLAFPIVTKKHSLEYFLCGNCGAISLSDKYFLSKEKQRERYGQHRNFLEDLGYAAFLATFLCDSLSFLPTRSFRLVLDYGSGPNPALVQLLRMVSARQRGGGACDRRWAGVDARQAKSLEELVDLLADRLPPLPGADFICGWDPFFACDGARGAGESDLVLCLEVAEHFESPREGFRGLADCCAAGGHVAVGTLPLPDSLPIPDGFKGWWYKDDRTHVSFYTEKAMAACGASCGLQYLGRASPRIFIFQKQGDV